MENKEHYFYVVSCRDNTLYAGYTNNIPRRMKMHNEGKGAKYTRGRGPVKLVFSKQFCTKSEALKAEYHFKKLGSRKKKEQYLVKEGSYVAAKEL
jgi:putative endonuclease